MYPEPTPTACSALDTGANRSQRFRQNLRFLKPHAPDALLIVTDPGLAQLPVRALRKVSQGQILGLAFGP